jgi:hypothetical protein
MPDVSHQTIKLSKGKHASPDQGACVMELASMLAGEPFSDHPRSVSRPISAFLRGYNDLVDGERRQDLYAYAARVVGTAAGETVELARARRLIAWGDSRWERGGRLGFLHRLRRSSARGRQLLDPDAAGIYAVHSIARISDATHASVLRLLDELIAMPDPAGPAAPAAPVQAREPVRARREMVCL